MCKEDVKLEPIKISFDGTTYYAKEKANKVGCRLTFSIKGPDDVIKMLESFADEDLYEVVAETKLHPDDEFNFEKGCKIAQAKAENMAYRRLDRMLNRITHRLMGVVDSFCDFSYKSDRVIKHNKEFISKF